MPKEEINVVLNTMLEEFNKNPDKFVQALESGKLTSIFATRGVQTAATVITGSWAAFSALAAFAIESSFASLQKRAGRLGVMKALEDLKDPSYYADDEAKIQKIQDVKTQPASSNNSEMLEKLINGKK